MDIQKLTLSDGRIAEKHISTDDDGNEVIEIFAQENRPLKLEQRIVREFKQVIARERHETITDGEVTKVEVRDITPEPPLQVVERIGIPEHQMVVDGDYVRRDEISKLVADAVVTGVATLLETHQPFEVEQPVVPTAKKMIEARVLGDGQKDRHTVQIVMGVILALQIAFFAYLYFA